MTGPVIWEPAAVRSLRALMADDHAAGQLVAVTVAALAGDPRPDGSAALGTSGFYRLRIGRFRVLYQVEDAGRVHVITVGRSSP